MSILILGQECIRNAYIYQSYIWCNIHYSNRSSPYALRDQMIPEYVIIDIDNGIINNIYCTRSLATYWKNLHLS